MEDNKVVSYLAFESAQARIERCNKRLWVLCIILMLSLILSNCGWLYYESQFEYAECTEVTQDCDCSGGSAVINDGVYIGARKTNG